jgi:hypothetical protein
MFNKLPKPLVKIKDSAINRSRTFTENINLSGVPTIMKIDEIAEIFPKFFEDTIGELFNLSKLNVFSKIKQKDIERERFF